MKLYLKWFVALGSVWALLPFQSGQAQVVPFKASGDDAVYAQPFVGGNGATSSWGQATHMGRVFGEGAALPTGVGNNWVTVGNYTLTGANGDRLFLNGGGTVTIFPLGGTLFYSIWSGDFHVAGGTGKFANVGPGTAPIKVVAINNPYTFADPVWTYSWTLIGDLDLGTNQ